MSNFRERIRAKLSQANLLAEIASGINNNATIQDLFRILKAKRDFIRPRSSINFLKATYKYTDEQEKNLPAFACGDKKTYIVHVCVWGDSYINKILDFFLPSLMAKNNIPAISSEYNVIIWVHCDKKSGRKILSSPIKKLIHNHAKLHIDVVPEKIFKLLYRVKSHWLTEKLNEALGYNAKNDWNYYLLGCLQNIAMLGSIKNRSLTSFFMPDNLISEDAISIMMQNIIGKKAVVVSGFRTACSKVKEMVSSKYVDYTLPLSGSFITNLIVKNMHSSAQRRIVSTKNNNFDVTAQLIYSYEDEIVIRTLIYHPIMVDFARVSKNIPSSYFPIDNNLLRNVIDLDKNIEEQMFVVTNSDALGIMEISDETDDGSEIAGLPGANVRGAITELINSPIWNKLNLYLLSKRLTYKMGEDVNNFILSDIPESELKNENS